MPGEPGCSCSFGWAKLGLPETMLKIRWEKDEMAKHNVNMTYEVDEASAIDRTHKC